MPRIYQATFAEETENGKTKTKRESRVINYGEEPPYVKLYLATVLFLRSLPKGYNPILLAFLKRMSYAQDGQKLYVNAAMKREIASELEVSVAYINNAITDLVKGKIMFRVDVGTYQFNAKMFGKGKWDDIAEIQAKITFNPEGTDFATEIIKADKRAANKKAIKEQAVTLTEPIIKELESLGQTTILDAIQETTAVSEPEPKTEKCRICGSELVERIRREDGKKFSGCPNFKRDDHKIKKHA